MSESKVRLTTEAQLTSLQQWRAEARGAKSDLEDLVRVMREASALGGASPTAAPGAPGTPQAPGAPTPPGTTPGPSYAPPQPPPPPGEPSQPRGGGPDYGGQAKAAGSWIQGKAAAIGGLVIGGSLMGFLLGAGQKFMEIDNVLNVLEHRFTSLQGSAMGFGHALGYTAAEAASMFETLGAQTNQVSGAQFQRYAGFTRYHGLDPSTLGTLGRMEEFAGGGITNNLLQTLYSRASGAGMGEGRFGEYLQGTAGLIEQARRGTGRADLPSLMALQNLPGQILGFENPVARGELGVDFVNRLQSGMTGGGAMRTMLLRMMGPNFGGQSYIEAMKQLEAGVNDPRNLRNISKFFANSGMGKNQQFVMMQSMFPQMKAWELEKMLGLPGATEEYTKDIRENRKRLADTTTWDYAKEGRKAIGAGQAYAVQTEGLQMKVGQDVAQALVSFKDAFGAILDAFKNIMGDNPGAFLADFAGAIKAIAEAAKSWSEDHKQSGRYSAAGFAKHPVDMTVEAIQLMGAGATPQSWQGGTLPGGRAPR